MMKPDWHIVSALTIAIAAALLLMVVGVVLFFLNKLTLIKLFEAGAVVGVMLFSGLLAYRFRYFGGWLLVFEGLLPIAYFIANGFVNVAVLALISIPLMVAGVLFVLE